MPMKPMFETCTSSTPSLCCQPRMSIAPASPANSPEIAHREDEIPRDADAAVARSLGVEADGSDFVAERRPVQDQIEDEQGRDGDEDADVQTLQGSLAPEDRQLRPLGDVVGDRD